LTPGAGDLFQHETAPAELAFVVAHAVERSQVSASEGCRDVVLVEGIVAREGFWSSQIAQPAEHRRPVFVRSLVGLDGIQLDLGVLRKLLVDALDAEAVVTRNRELGFVSLATGSVRVLRVTVI
jgi:hypothetical protein